MRVLGGTLVDCVGPLELRIRENVYIGIDDITGVIQFIETELDSSMLDSVEYIPQGYIVIPGFVDTHVHAPQYVFTGYGNDLPLFQWLKQYTYPTESKFTDLEFAKYSHFSFCLLTCRVVQKSLL